MIETDRIYAMDCLEGMKRIADHSIAAVIADLPYGVLNRRNKFPQGSCCRNPSCGGTILYGRKIA